MKKLFVLFILLSSPMFSQETKKSHSPSTFNRFGMEVLSIGSGFGFYTSPFPLSFFVANDNNNIISFGLDTTFNITLLDVPNPDDRSLVYGIGGHIGFGKMYQSKREENLYLGYLINFHAGYKNETIYNLPFYVGFSPNLVLEINQFLFKAGIYFDSSLVVTSTISFGFLLDNE